MNTLFSGAGASDPRCHQLTWRQMATLTLHPKVVLTARAGRPKSLKSLENDCVNEIRGRSSATTMHVRTHDRFTPFICRRARSHSTTQSPAPSALTKGVSVGYPWGLAIDLSTYRQVSSSSASIWGVLNAEVPVSTLETLRPTLCPTSSQTFLSTGSASLSDVCGLGMTTMAV